MLHKVARYKIIPRIKSRSSLGLNHNFRWKADLKLTFSFSAFLRKKALHDSHDMASKLQPRALSPQTPHILSPLSLLPFPWSEAGDLTCCSKLASVDSGSILMFSIWLIVPSPPWKINPIKLFYSYSFNTRCSQSYIRLSHRLNYVQSSGKVSITFYPFFGILIFCN